MTNTARVRTEPAGEDRCGRAGLRQYTLEYPFGDVYSRPRLDIRARQIATVSALVTLGTIDQLRIHLRICLEIGISHEEIAEVLIQLSVYAGWPRALSAMTVAGEVFAEGESKS